MLLKIRKMISSILSSLNIQTVLIGLVVVLVIYKLLQRLKYRQPPGPFAWPLIGNYDVIKAKFQHEKCFDLAQKYGPIFTIYLGPFKMVILNDINVVTEALVKRQADFAGRPYIASVYKFTEGQKDIAFADYSPTWKLHRKIAGKALRQYMVGMHLENMVHDSMKQVLKRMAEETGPFDPEPYIDLMVFNILTNVCFGSSSASIDDSEFKHFMKLNKDVNDTFGNGLVEDMFPILVHIWPSKKYTTVMALGEEMINFFRKKLKEHEDTFDPDNIRDFTDTLIMAKRDAEDEDNLDLQNKLTNTHLVQTLFDIFVAGIDTSRMTLYFAVRFLAGLPEIQTKVQDELDTVVGQDRLPGLKDRELLSYGEATLHEVMRLGTAAPTGLPHAAICDSKIAGYDIPKGTTILINHWALHRDPRYWKDVEKLDPNRFLDDDGKLGSKPESWLPFSAGRRVCLGETVAKPELHLIFSSIFQRFKITLPEGTNPDMEYAGNNGALQPAPFKIIVEDRMKSS